MSKLDHQISIKLDAYNALAVLKFCREFINDEYSMLKF